MTIGNGISTLPAYRPLLVTIRYYAAPFRQASYDSTEPFIDWHRDNSDRDMNDTAYQWLQSAADYHA